MRQTELNTDSDTLLLQQIEKGSRHAFNVLFEKYWEKAFSDAYKRIKNRDDAKDIVQEIFTHIWINREKKHIENLPGYLHVAVRNKVIKFVSKQKMVHPFFDILNSIPGKNYKADGQLLWKEFFKSYEALVERLPPKRREIFRLRFHEDLSTKVISMQLRISRKTVQNQLGKAIDTLRLSFMHALIFTFLIFVYA